jgi:hypothetical protein
MTKNRFVNDLTGCCETMDTRSKLMNIISGEYVQLHYERDEKENWTMTYCIEDCYLYKRYRFMFNDSRRGALEGLIDFYAFEYGLQKEQLEVVDDKDT